MNNTNNTPSWEHDALIHGWWVIPGRLLATATATCMVVGSRRGMA
jgi:hypothetical protein